MPLTTTEPVCWPDAQRIAASRPFHGTGGDALLALGLPSRVHLVMHEEHHHLSRGLGVGVGSWSNWNIRWVLQPLSPLPRAGTQAQMLASNAPRIVFARSLDNWDVS